MKIWEKREAGYNLLVDEDEGGSILNEEMSKFPVKVPDVVAKCLEEREGLGEEAVEGFSLILRGVF